MEYNRFDNSIIIRLDPGDEVCESIVNVAIHENVKIGRISGIGGADRLCTGVFDMIKKDYNLSNYSGIHEITSLVGNITNRDGLPYVHLHVTAIGADNNIVAGHLLSAHISLTAEIIIDVIDGEIGRIKCDKYGINKMRF